MTNKSKGIKEVRYKILVSVSFGLLGFFTNLNTISFPFGEYTAAILLGLLFPMLIALNWGWKYGLLCAVSGGCQSMWWLWGPSNGYAIFSVVPSFTLWVVWHGIFATLRQNQKAAKWWLNMYIIEMPFRIVNTINLFTLSRWLITRNPPPWNWGANASNTISMEFSSLVAVKQAAVGYIILLMADVLLHMNPVRRFFKIKEHINSRRTGFIISTFLLLGCLFWVVDSIFCTFTGHDGRSFIDFLILNVPDHNLFVRTVVFIFCLASGLLSSMFLKRQRKAEIDFRQSEEQLLAFFNHGNIGMAITSLEKGWINVNKKLCDMLGYSKEELMGMTWTEMTYPDDLEPDLAWFNQMASGKIQNYELEKRFYRKDKSIIYTHLTVSCSRNPQGGIENVMATLQDISEKKISEKHINHLNKVLRAVRGINQLIVRERNSHTLIREGCKLLVNHRGYKSAMIVLTDEKNSPVFWAESGLGAAFKPVETMLKGFELPPCCHEGQGNDIVIIDDRHQHCAACPIAAKRVHTHSLITRLVHNSIVFGYLIVELEKDSIVDDQELTLFSEMAGDISYALNFLRTQTAHVSSEKKRASLQEQLIQAQKIESVGRLAGGVAHDFNNMLSIIMGYSNMAMDSLDANAPLYDDIKEIYMAGKRSAQITKQLLAFARQQTTAPKVLDLNSNIENMLKMLRRLIGEDIDLAWFPGSTRWQVKIDPTQLDQILANLCVNARDAIEGIGKVTIETKNVVFDDDYCADHTGFIPGEYVMFSVSDTGCGISPDILNTIFDPFFTTKKRNQGTGLGLSTVYGIVKQNNGFINVYSEPGHGTVFKIYLPRNTEQLKTIRQKEKGELPLGQGETVMLVEDDPFILKMGEKMLISLGYCVLSANSPKAAVAMAQKNTRGIDLLVTDVVMPEMNGRELSEKLQSLFPGLQTLFMSGYTANVIAHRGVLEEGIHFIPKPLSQKELAKKIRELLHGTS
nr:PAS domain S-box protein [uncultured Desulfobacter sp.]